MARYVRELGPSNAMLAYWRGHVAHRTALSLGLFILRAWKPCDEARDCVRTLQWRCRRCRLRPAFCRSGRARRADDCSPAAYHAIVLGRAVVESPSWRKRSAAILLVLLRRRGIAVAVMLVPEKKIEARPGLVARANVRCPTYPRGSHQPPAEGPVYFIDLGRG